MEGRYISENYTGLRSYTCIHSRNLLLLFAVVVVVCFCFVFVKNISLERRKKGLGVRFPPGKET